LERNGFKYSFRPAGMKKSITIQLTPELIKRLKIRVAEEATTQVDLITALIEGYLEGKIILEADP
jgi:hypothetical protein